MNSFDCFPLNKNILSFAGAFEQFQFVTPLKCETAEVSDVSAQDEIKKGQFSHHRMGFIQPGFRDDVSQQDTVVRRCCPGKKSPICWVLFLEGINGS